MLFTDIVVDTVTLVSLILNVFLSSYSARGTKHLVKCGCHPQVFVFSPFLFQVTMDVRLGGVM